MASMTGQLHALELISISGVQKHGAFHNVIFN